MGKQTLNAFPATLIACLLALTPLSAHAQLILYDAVVSQDNVLTGSVHLEFTDDGGSHELIALSAAINTTWTATGYTWGINDSTGNTLSIDPDDWTLTGTLTLNGPFGADCIDEPIHSNCLMQFPLFNFFSDSSVNFTGSESRIALAPDNERLVDADGTVLHSVVPLPPALFLFVSGLIAIGVRPFRQWSAKG